MNLLHAAPTKKQKLPIDILDSIRGIAALYVVIAHARGVLWMGGSEYIKLFPRATWNMLDYVIFGSSMLTRLAVEFVIIFFVLSGFSIAHSLASRSTPLAFYKKRFIRIYPPYLVALVWAGIIFSVTLYFFPQWYDGTYTQGAFIRTMEMNQFFDGKTIAGNLFYMPSAGFISPFWSLTYEVIFYFLAPFLLKRPVIYLVVSLLLFLFYSCFPSAVEAIQLPRYVHEYLFTYNIYFATGVFLYRYYDMITHWFRNFTTVHFVSIIAVLLIIMYGTNFYFQIETVFSFIEAAMLSCILIIFFLKSQVRIPWLISIGRFSYTLYITHFATIFLYLAVYWWIAKPSVPYNVNYLVWIPAVFFCLAIAFLQYKLVEKNTKSILERLRKKEGVRNE